jgi:hypothetical protein
MPINEAQLDTWSRQGAVKQSRDTYASIKPVLESKDAPYAGKTFQTFLQGSYANDTNVYAESDVDIVIQLDSIFYYDLNSLPEPRRAVFRQKYPDAVYHYSDFKRDVIAWLSSKYQRVKPGKKAVFVPGGNNRRDADVLVATQFRRYTDFADASNERYRSGLCFLLDNGTRIENFPKQHSANCTTKHQNTKQWFKPTVRVFKNMRNHMVREGLLPEGVAPSYFVEGFLYNVPDANFGGSYNDTFVNCFNWLNKADKSALVCANGLQWLIRDNTPTSWPSQNCQAFLNAARDLWNQW